MAPDNVHDDSRLSKAEQAYEWIRARIRSREYPPGHRLVLSAIAEEFAISPVPVREAIRQLEAEGLVTYERNVGARVSTLNQEAYFETMETIALLEGRATALSVPHLGPPQIAKARELNEKMEATLADFDPKAFTELNWKFHRTLFGCCPNSRLLDLLYTEWERLDYFRDSTFRFIPQRAQSSVQEHEQLIKLIEAGVEPSYVERKIRDHRLVTSTTYRTIVNSTIVNSTNDSA
ncbi:GntR family transcriptional regulator [Corynebacterium testudinoris]|uniref:Transcriptional regulator n=1 Tax=Corynebacterium testudinoris TaxID=136857 RepID=A0A0G3H4J8_9CORY|nr:GntR family transcriptional regulator [Corynebacterium testudinoris]AKK07640.1 transcriptional regulator [Corynebacterium testudinoris]MBX8996071.1 GntR family transcriptional regulator [Corynebacterium testudinoris]